METFTTELIEEFNNMDKMPIFEIEHNGEYYIYNITATEDGISAECGIAEDWDNCFSLDEHLQSLYDLCLEDAEEQEGTNMSYLEKMLDEMNSGNWKTAQDLFKAINPTGREFTDAMSNLDLEQLKDIALLGFYCRDYNTNETIVDYSKEQI